MPYAISGIQQLREAMEEKGINSKRLMAYPNAGMARLDKNQRTYWPQDTRRDVALPTRVNQRGCLSDRRLLWYKPRARQSVSGNPISAKINNGLCIP